MTRVSPTVPALCVAALLLAAPAAAAPHPRVGGGDACSAGQCHSGFAAAPAAGRSAHDPAASGECAACHDLSLPAGGRYLRGATPAAQQARARGDKAWDVVLCSGCHGGIMASRSGQAPETAFAAGKRDLHVLHVMAAQGRGCVSCHDPHAAPQPHLLRAAIPARGTVKIPQSFRQEERGGWCRTGCHAPKSYRRE